MFTVTELIAAMEKSGRRLTSRTARNWWSVGVLPKPDSRGLGRGKGKVVFWPDRRVLSQAQLAHDLLSKGASLRSTAAGLGLLGFPVPLKVVRTEIENQIAGYYRRLGTTIQGDGLEEKLWEFTEQIVRQDARARGGSQDDQEGRSLYAVRGQLLELLYGIGDGAPPSENAGQWAVDTAAEVVTHLDLLAPQVRSHSVNTASKWMGMTPDIKAKTANEVVTFVSKTMSVKVQSTAVASARSYDWTRARRLTHMVVGLLDRAFAVASPQEHITNRALFGRQAAAWALLLFPVVLAVVQNSKRYQTATEMIFAAAARIRHDARTSSMTE